MMNFNWARK